MAGGWSGASSETTGSRRRVVAMEGPFMFCAFATLHKHVSNYGQDPQKEADIGPHSRRCMSAVGDPQRALRKSPRSIRGAPDGSKIPLGEL